jgi:hypothetical protein
VGWVQRELGEGTVPVEATVAFPSRLSRVVLEEPDVEVLTAENAPWWAQRVGRVQRMDAGRVVAFADAVVTESRRQATARSARPTPRPPRARRA